MHSRDSFEDMECTIGDVRARINVTIYTCRYDCGHTIPSKRHGYAHSGAGKITVLGRSCTPIRMFTLDRQKIFIRRFEPGRWFTDFQLTQIRAVNATLPILSCFETPAIWHHNPYNCEVTLCNAITWAVRAFAQLFVGRGFYSSRLSMSA